MSHTEIIWLVVTLSFTSTVGVYATIRYIKLHTTPPVNTLVRSGDIELGDYIEQTQPIYNYPDLTESAQIINYPDLPEPLPIITIQQQYERITNFVHNERVHSFLSSNPPSYHTMDRWNINSCLENSINLDFIPWLIFLSILIAFIIIFKYFKTNVSIFLIPNLFLIFGLFMDSLYAMSILIPFSLFEINFRESFEWKFNSYWVKPKISYLKLQTLTKDIDFLLLSLIDDVNYSMSLSFISSYKEWTEDKEKIQPLFINDPIIVNKESDSLLITQFIMQNLNKKGYFITNQLINDDLINQIDPVILTVTVAIKVEI